MGRPPRGPVEGAQDPLPSEAARRRPDPGRGVRHRQRARWRLHRCPRLDPRSHRERSELTERLRQQTDELAHRVEAQRRSPRWRAQLTSLRDPSAVLEQTLHAAVRLLEGRRWPDRHDRDRRRRPLRWGDGHSLVARPTWCRSPRRTAPRSTRASQGVPFASVARPGPPTTSPTTRSPTSGTPTASPKRLGIRAVIAAPLIGEDGPIGRHRRLLRHARAPSTPMTASCSGSSPTRRPSC